MNQVEREYRAMKANGLRNVRKAWRVICGSAKVRERNADARRVWAAFVHSPNLYGTERKSRKGRPKS